MKPTKHLIGYEAAYPRMAIPSDSSFAETAKTLFIEGSYKESEHHILLGNDARYEGPGVAWNGHEFETVTLNIEHESDDSRIVMYLDQEDPHEWVSLLHYPLDPRADEIDWKGAIHAYPNATDDGWLPAHCDADFHHDHELRLDDVIISLFQPEVDRLQQDWMIKLGTLARDPSDSSRGSRELVARIKYDDLLTVRGHILKCARKETREKHLGWYHQNPLRSHLREEIIDCASKAIGFNKLARTETYSNVDAELQRIMAGLRDKSAWETRWDKKARLKAEAAAQAEQND